MKLKLRRTVFFLLAVFMAFGITAYPMSAYAAVTPTISASKAADAISVKWNAVSGTSKFRVYRKEAKENDFSVIASSVSGLNYLDKTVKSGKSYTYKVRGLSGNGKSFTTARSTRTPLIFFLNTPKLTLVNQKKGISISWSATTGSSGIQYKLYRRASNATTWTQLAVQSGRTYLDTSAIAGTKYEYKVQSIDSKGHSSGARTASITYTASKDSKKPATPVSETPVKNRYVVSCNINYSNKVNTLGKYNTKEKAIAAVKAQPAKTRDQWYVYDSQNKMQMVYPVLKTDQQRIQQAVKWMIAVSQDHRHGYSTVGESSDHNTRISLERWGKYGDYSCSTFVIMALELSGVANLRDITEQYALVTRAQGKSWKYSISSINIAEACLKTGKFENVTAKVKKTGKSALKVGDILVRTNARHVAVYIGNGMIVHAVTNELNSEYRKPKPGDQRGGKELITSSVGSLNRSGYSGWGTIIRLKR